MFGQHTHVTADAKYVVTAGQVRLEACFSGVSVNMASHCFAALLARLCCWHFEARAATLEESVQATQAPWWSIRLPA